MMMTIMMMVMSWKAHVQRQRFSNQFVEPLFSDRRVFVSQHFPVLSQEPAQQRETIFNILKKNKTTITRPGFVA